MKKQIMWNSLSRGSADFGQSRTTPITQLEDQHLRNAYRTLVIKVFDLEMEAKRRGINLEPLKAKLISNRSKDYEQDGRTDESRGAQSTT